SKRYGKKVFRLLTLLSRASSMAFAEPRISSARWTVNCTSIRACSDLNWPMKLSRSRSKISNVHTTISATFYLNDKDRPPGLGGWNVVHRLRRDRKSTRLNSSHVAISYAVFCLKKKKNKSNIIQKT